MDISIDATMNDLLLERPVEPLHNAVPLGLGDQTPAEAYGIAQPMDMMDKASALPTSPQAQQLQQNVINRILAA